TRVHPDGHTSITKTPKITGKGQIYFINKFKSSKQLSMLS
ncbi:phage antirepressor KilAC domain-containing protein, partial [Clostridioides difficile]